MFVCAVEIDRQRQTDRQTIVEIDVIEIGRQTFVCAVEIDRQGKTDSHLLR